MSKSTFTSNYRVLLDELKAARDRAGLTQTDLATALGMTQSKISKVERGERRLDIVELHQWCQALGIPFLDLARRLDRRFR